MAVAQQPAGDRDRLADRLPLTEDRLRHPLSEDTMVIHRGEPQVLIGQRLQPARGLLGVDPAGLHLRQQPPDAIRRHGQSISGRAARSIRSVTARRESLPSKSTAYTSRTMGISTRWCSARAFAALAVPTPSATVRVPARMSASFFPCPSWTPTDRFRLSPPAQVRTRSPIRETPAQVRASAPMTVPRPTLSTRPP